jgi:hypothetical protein
MLLPKAEMGRDQAGLSFVHDPGFRIASDIVGAALS